MAAITLLLYARANDNDDNVDGGGGGVQTAQAAEHAAHGGQAQPHEDPDRM